MGAVWGAGQSGRRQSRRQRQSAVGVNIWSPGQLIFTPLSEAIAGAGIINLFAVNPNFRPSYTYSYNLNVQQSFGPNVITQVGYVGSAARHLLDVRDINQATLGSGNDHWLI